MADRAAIPVIRLKLPCSGELEFRERFASRYAAGGVFIPTEKRRSPGSHVRLIVEFNDKTGAHLSGEAVVTSHLELGGKKGMKLRFLSLDPDSVPFDLAPAGLEPSESDVPAPPQHPQATTPLELELFAGQEPPPASDASRPLEVRSKPVTLRVKDAPLAAGHDLDPSEFELIDPPQPAPRAHNAAQYQELFGPEDFAREPAAPPPPRLTTTPAGTPIRPAPEAARPARRSTRRLWLRVLLGLVSVGVVAELVLAWPDIRDKLLAGDQGMQSPADSELQLADSRAEEGRLVGSGGDAALDHLLRARQLAPPGDRRIRERLVLLADKLQALANVAMSRGNLNEAAAHINAALQADPARSVLEDQLTRISRERAARNQATHPAGSAAPKPAAPNSTSPPAAPPAPHSAP
jgi:hypothetical protein